MNCSLCETPLHFDDTLKKVYEGFSFTYKQDHHSFPLPDICFHCTRQRLLLFTNERNLYKSTESLRGKDIISMYSPDKTIPVYEKQDWMSGNWDGLDYGFEIHNNVSFFEQFKELRNKVPVVALNLINCENSEYNNNLIGCKDAYMCFGNESLDDCHYVTGSFATKSSLDVWWSTVENSYEIFNCGNLYKSYFCSNCTESRDLILCDNCFGCKDCIMSSNLVNQQYYILNKAYSKEEYFNKKKELSLGSYSSLELLKKIYENFLQTTPKIFSDTVGSENVKGDYIYYSKNCYNCYNIINAEECSSVSEGGRIKNVAYSTIIYSGEGRIISSTMIYESSNISFSMTITSSHNISYSSDLISCNFCFGCVGLRFKKYCVFNIQYSEDEYHKKVNEVIIAMKKHGEWGKIFSPDISLFGYNESLAQDEFPLSKQDAIDQNFLWSNYEKPFPNVSKTIPASKLPDKISDIPDDILNWALICEKSDMPYKITEQELKFYRKHSITIPRLHPTERYLERLKKRNVRRLYLRLCYKCNSSIESTYNPDRIEKIYCRKCFDSHVFG